MPQYIVRFPAASANAPASWEQEDRATVKAFQEVTVLDESPKMLLIEATAETADQLQTRLKDAAVNPVQQYAVPDTHQSIR